jgi:hypothetical protein
VPGENALQSLILTLKRIKMMIDNVIEHGTIVYWLDLNDGCGMDIATYSGFEKGSDFSKSSG